MNTLGPLQSKWSPVNFARDPKNSWFREHPKNWIYGLYLHLINIINYL